MGVSYALVQPIKDNKAAFSRLFPKTPYLGDVGDAAHMKGSGDHTPWSSDSIGGKKMKRGFVYAQDFGTSTEFDIRRFSPWLLTQCSMGKYPEVKYVISRVPGSGAFRGTPVYGLYDRRYGWKRQESSGHSHHVHISYMPGYEQAHSRIIADYAASLRGPQGKAPVAPPRQAAPPVSIKGDTYFKGRKIGGPVADARAVFSGQAPVLNYGAGDTQLGGWVTYAEQKLGVPPNGYYGPEMVEAVKALQRRKGYEVTGTLGGREWNSLGQPKP